MISVKIGTYLQSFEIRIHTYVFQDYVLSKRQFLQSSRSVKTKPFAHCKQWMMEKIKLGRGERRTSYVAQLKTERMNNKMIQIFMCEKLLSTRRWSGVLRVYKRSSIITKQRCWTCENISTRAEFFPNNGLFTFTSDSPYTQC